MANKRIDMELTPELKQKIVDEVNSDQPEPESNSNTTLFTMSSMKELHPFLKELTNMEMFDKSVVLNQTSAANLAVLLPKMSKKNLIKLFFATIKLPDPDAVLNFGGTQEDRKVCELAYANSQLARNALVHVLGTTAIAQAKLVKKRELEAAQEEKSENKEGEDNE